MYSRQLGDRTYTFEASGGLLNASLVMRDRETDSWWSIINEEAIHGPAEGQRLEQVSGSAKTTWGDWRRLYPHTRVLSVDGQEHEPETPYDRYFASEEGFRKLKARDDRLRDKEAIYAFHFGGKPYAVPHSELVRGGGVVRLGERQLFLYRREDDSFYRSTVALLAVAGAGFSTAEGGWRLAGGGSEQSFRPAERAFEGEETLDAESLAETFAGFDTFWYLWSLTNPETEILRASSP